MYIQKYIDRREKTTGTSDLISNQYIFTYEYIN